MKTTKEYCPYEECPCPGWCKGPVCDFLAVASEGGVEWRLLEPFEKDAIQRSEDADNPHG